jgi:hypothetical protein
MALKGDVFDLCDITDAMIEEMYTLMGTYYENVNRNRFYSDLKDKDKVLILFDEENTIRGFTGIKAYDFEVGDVPVRLMFSGDTIIHQSYWGELQLPKLWINMVYSLRDKASRNYWLLISKGYKTYRFLPVCFYNFYPRYDSETPDFEQRIMDTFGRSFYPQDYDPRTGVIYMRGKKDYLKQGVSDLTEHRLKDPHVEFFMNKNPGQAVGDELVCITELVLENIKPLGRRFLRGGV